MKSKKYYRRRRRRSRRRRRRRRRRSRRKKRIRRKSRRKKKRRRPRLSIKIQRGGGFFGDMMKKAGSMAMEEGKAFAKQKLEQGKADLLAKSKSMLNEKTGGIFDKISSFSSGGIAADAGEIPGGLALGGEPDREPGGEPGGGPGAPGGGGGGGASVKINPCDENKRPDYPKGPDGCGKYESPKPTVKQLKDGYVQEDSIYQLENF